MEPLFVYDDKFLDELTYLKVRFNLPDLETALVTAVSVLKGISEVDRGTSRLVVFKNGAMYRVSNE